MAKNAICDNCGDKDDWAAVKGKPFLYGGVVIQLRPDSGAEEPEYELEICSNCKEKLLKKFPKLQKALDKKVG